MNAYERGFNDGEHASFQDRRHGRRRRIIGEPLGEYQRGFAAGYVPRDLSWLLAQPPKSWTDLQEKDE